MSLAVVRDMRETRVPAGAEEAAALETDVLAGFVLARAAAGLELRHKAEIYQLTAMSPSARSMR